MHTGSNLTANVYVIPTFASVSLKTCLPEFSRFWSEADRSTYGRVWYSYVPKISLFRRGKRVMWIALGGGIDCSSSLIAQ